MLIISIKIFRCVHICEIEIFGTFWKCQYSLFMNNAEKWIWLNLFRSWSHKLIYLLPSSRKKITKFYESSYNEVLKFCTCSLLSFNRNMSFHLNLSQYPQKEKFFVPDFIICSSVRRCCDNKSQYFRRSCPI